MVECLVIRRVMPHSCPLFPHQIHDLIHSLLFALVGLIKSLKNNDTTLQLPFNDIYCSFHGPLCTTSTHSEVTLTKPSHGLGLRCKLACTVVTKSN